MKIAIDAGHGGSNSTPGKRSPDGEYEWNFNNTVVRAFMEEISTYENVQLLRVDDEAGKKDVSLTNRTNAANSWGADMYLSFHHNANSGSWGQWTGTETFVYTKASKKSQQIAKSVQLALLQAYNLKDRGVKVADFHVLRETTMPAILIEGGFMDSLIDIKRLRSSKVLRQAGINAAIAVAKLENLKKKSGNTGIFHTVKYGDTLWGLSKQYNSMVANLKLWNGLSSDSIYEGDILKVRHNKS